MRLGSVFIPMATLLLPDTLLFNAFCQIAIPLAVTAELKALDPIAIIPGDDDRYGKQLSHIPITPPPHQAISQVVLICIAISQAVLRRLTSGVTHGVIFLIDMLSILHTQLASGVNVNGLVSTAVISSVNVIAVTIVDH